MKQWTERDATARSGIVKMDRVVTDTGHIWRPTPNSDVGIDCEIELAEDPTATAKIIKVQVKTGPSYFRKEDQRSFELHTSITEEEKVDAGHELQNLWICSRGALYKTPFGLPLAKHAQQASTRSGMENHQGRLDPDSRPRAEEFRASSS